MRIIAGTHRGRRLLAPETEETRPITDRVKQSLFDMLMPRLEDARVLDIFAGTGSMGLESLSRGARHARFFESGRSPLRLLRQNIDSLGFADRSTIMPVDVFKWSPKPEAADSADLVFLDPPYRFLTERAGDLQKLAAKLAAQLARDGVVLFRHDTSDSLDLHPLLPYDRREYGSMTIELLAGPKSQTEPGRDKGRGELGIAN
jgi:16S rRNA (guanine966-N2)-methyltransferase